MFKPVNRMVFVEPDKAPDKTDTGIILPMTNNKQVLGTVVLSNSDLAKPGDRVVYNRFSNVPIPTSKLVDAPSLLGIYERDLVGVDDGNDTPFPIPAPK